jgi:hypothetical protein
MDIFREIFDVATQYLALTNTSRTQVPILTIESGVLSFLYIIAMNCRDPSIRPKAIKLFTTAIYQEVLWEGAVFVRFVKEVGASSRRADRVVEAGDVLEV